MRTNVLEKPEVQFDFQSSPVSDRFIPTHPPKLVAQWLIIDEKLICKWHVC